MSRAYFSTITQQKSLIHDHSYNYGYEHPRGISPDDNIIPHEPYEGNNTSKGWNKIAQEQFPLNSTDLFDLSKEDHWITASADDHALITMSAYYLLNSSSFINTIQFLVNILGCYDDGYYYDEDALLIFEMKTYPAKIKFFVNNQGKITELSIFNTRNNEDLAIPLDLDGFKFVLKQIFINFRQVNFNSSFVDYNKIDIAKTIGSHASYGTIKDASFELVCPDPKKLDLIINNWFTKAEHLDSFSDPNDEEELKCNHYIRKTHSNTYTLKQDKGRDEQGVQNSNNINPRSFDELYPSTKIPFFSLKNILSITGCLGRLNYILINSFVALANFIILIMCVLILTSDLPNINQIDEQTQNLIIGFIAIFAILFQIMIGLFTTIRRLHDLGYSSALIFAVIILSFIPFINIIMLIALLLLPGASYYQSLHNSERLKENKIYMEYYVNKK